MNPAMIAQMIINGILIGGIYAVISVSLNIIFGVLKVINFAHGEFLMLSMYASYWLCILYGLNPYIALPLTTAIMFVFGVALERILIKPLLKAPPINQLLSTAALMLVLQNIALVLWHADYRSLTIGAFSIRLGDIYISGHRLIALIGALATTLLFYYFLMRTDTGRRIRAVAQDPEVSSILGINVPLIKTLTFGLGAALAGIAGALMISIYFVYPTVGTSFGLMAWIIIVLGGLGSFIGAFIGSFIIGLIESIAATIWSLELAKAIAFIVFLLVLFFKPTGLFGEKARV